MQTQQLSSTPFGSANVTSATIDNLTMRISILEEKMNKLNSSSSPPTTTQINTAPLVPPTIIPPTRTVSDLTSIFPKTGGRRKKTARRKKRRT